MLRASLSLPSIGTIRPDLRASLNKTFVLSLSITYKRRMTAAANVSGRLGREHFRFIKVTKRSNNHCLKGRFTAVISTHAGRVTEERKKRHSTVATFDTAAGRRASYVMSENDFLRRAGFFVITVLTPSPPSPSQLGFGCAIVR